METEKRAELAGLLESLPPVEFCCVYGSSLHQTTYDKSTMVDYIIGVRDPVWWHSENLKMNQDHYASWILRLGGARLITGVADEIGVGVHFNPYVAWNDKIFKYGVVRVNTMIQDIIEWESFYLSGRLQKPVHIFVDELDLRNSNLKNLRAATAAALLLLPSKFTEEDLYAKICSLSYAGDLRMLFAEDKNKVKKMVLGQFGALQAMYRPILEEYEAMNLFRFSSSVGHHANITQDCSLSSARSLVSSLPSTITKRMGIKLGEYVTQNQSGGIINEVVVKSREEAAKCMQNILSRMVKISSARQAVSGLVAVGGFNAVRYVARKVCKAQKSWMS